MVPKELFVSLLVLFCTTAVAHGQNSTGSVLLLTWSAVSSYASFYPIKSGKFYSYLDLTDELEKITLDGGSIKLVGSTDQFYYFGGLNGLYRVSWSVQRSDPELVAAVGSVTQPVTVQYLYILGNPPSTAFVCSASVLSTAQSASSACRLFNITAELPWQPVELPNRRISSLLTGFLMPSSVREPARISLRLNGSHVFISNYPQVYDTLDIIELRWPRFDRIGWLTADFISRRNREPWISRLARPVAMATRGEKLYALFTEEAFEASNYFSSVSGEAFRTSAAVVKLPRFTRLARVCLNDPGSQPASQDIRVMTSFFKMRLICRNGSVDYDVLELATEVSPSDPGAFYGVFSLQNSPSPNGYGALCRFSLADAESLIATSDFIQLQQAGLMSYNAKRLSRSAYAEASGRPQPTRCKWTPDEARKLSLRDLKVERTAPLIARPLISNSLLEFKPVPTDRGSGGGGGGIASLSWVAATAQGDVLAFGTDSGALIKVFIPAASSSAAGATPAHPIETVQLFPPGTPSRIDSVSARAGRLLVVSDSAGAALWLPQSRCGRVSACAACVALRDPQCSWRSELGDCAFQAEPLGLSNVSSGFHNGCPISSRDLAGECHKLSGSASNENCQNCLNNTACMYCFTDHKCKPYPVGHLIPGPSDCPLGDARWGTCFVNFLALIICMSVLAFVIIVVVPSCIYCYCCRAKSGPSHSQNDRKKKYDKIRAKFGLHRSRVTNEDTNPL